MTDSTATEPPAVPASSDRELVLSQVEIAALKAGTEIPAALKNALNVSAFVDENGNTDHEVIDQLVSYLPKPEPANPYAQNIGIGPQGENRSMVTSREQLSRMSPHEIVKAVKDGRISIT